MDEREGIGQGREGGSRSEDEREGVSQETREGVGQGIRERE